MKLQTICKQLLDKETSRLYMNDFQLKKQQTIRYTYIVMSIMSLQSYCKRIVMSLQVVPFLSVMPPTNSTFHNEVSPVMINSSVTHFILHIILFPVFPLLFSRRNHHPGVQGIHISAPFAPANVARYAYFDLIILEPN